MSVSFRSTKQVHKHSPRFMKCVLISSSACNMEAALLLRRRYKWRKGMLEVMTMMFWYEYVEKIIRSVEFYNNKRGKPHCIILRAAAAYYAWAWNVFLWKQLSSRQFFLFTCVNSESDGTNKSVIQARIGLRRGFYRGQSFRAFISSTSTHYIM